MGIKIVRIACAHLF